MARMIPAVLDPLCSSPGEVEIFNLLSRDPGAADWIVLHSLDLAHHSTQITGEIDFVVVVPAMGILCLEVKASRQINRDHQGLWFYGRSSKQGDPRGPFKQAANACYSLRERTCRNAQAFRGLLFFSAVVFPYLDFQLQSPEWHSWQAIDRQIFRARSMSEICIQVLKRAREHVSEKSSVRIVNGRPTVSECRQLANIWRPHFELIESSKCRALRQEDELNHYTQQQFEALDMIAENERVLFTGPAGTGKTLLALEAARRACLKGEKTLLLCFNRHLAKMLHQQTSSWSIRPTVKTLHRFMLDVTGLDASSHAEDPSFWSIELPDRACELLLEQGRDMQYQCLVVDEAQDLCSESYLDCLELSLEGGLRTGKWKFFGDFAQQSLYGNDEGQQLLELRSRYTKFALLDNCRNTPRIGAYATLLGGLHPSYRKFRRPDDSVEPDVHVYETTDEQVSMLRKCIDDFVEQGYKPTEIVVLSFKKDCVARITQSRTWTLTPLGSQNDSQIPYCTVHAFKGLEAHCVIITDIEYSDASESSALFYIGVTRALFHLRCLLAASSKDAVLKALRRKNG